MRQEALTKRDRRYRRNLAAAIAIVAVLNPFGTTGSLLSRTTAVRPATAQTPTTQDLRGAPGKASTPSCRGVDRLLETIVVHRGVDRRGPDVGVPRKLADDVDRDTSVGQVCAERVTQHVGRATVDRQPGGGRVARHDPRDVADSQRP